MSTIGSVLVCVLLSREHPKAQLGYFFFLFLFAVVVVIVVGESRDRTCDPWFTSDLSTQHHGGFFYYLCSRSYKIRPDPTQTNGKLMEKLVCHVKMVLFTITQINMNKGMGLRANSKSLEPG